MIRYIFNSSLRWPFKNSRSTCVVVHADTMGKSRGTSSFNFFFLFTLRHTLCNISRPQQWAVTGRWPGGGNTRPGDTSRLSNREAKPNQPSPEWFPVGRCVWLSGTAGIPPTHGKTHHPELARCGPTLWICLHSSSHLALENFLQMATG